MCGKFVSCVVVCFSYIYSKRGHSYRINGYLDVCIAEDLGLKSGFVCILQLNFIVTFRGNCIVHVCVVP